MQQAKTDKRRQMNNARPEITSCRGGVRMVLNGRNTKGKQAQVTVFIDNAFLPMIVGDIANIANLKAKEAQILRERVKAAANVVQ